MIKQALLVFLTTISFSIIRTYAENVCSTNTILCLNKYDSIVNYKKDSLTIPQKNLIIKKLDSISDTDQKYRSMIDSIEGRYGIESIQSKQLWKLINSNDSIKLNKVSSILDRYGWLGSDEIGKKGNETLFLVIQHSNKKTMEKYLPMLTEAVKKELCSSKFNGYVTR